MNRKNLENRLVAFSTLILKLCKSCKFDYLTIHLSKQIVRSSSSAALNYGEAQSAESKSDFIHKLSLTLKELRETQINLKLIHDANICQNQDLLSGVVQENSELVAIFQKSIHTLVKGKGKR